MGLDRTESGTLTLKKPGRMRWSYDSPPGKVFVLDGSSPGSTPPATPRSPAPPPNSSTTCTRPCASSSATPSSPRARQDHHRHPTAQTSASPASPREWPSASGSSPSWSPPAADPKHEDRRDRWRRDRVHLHRPSRTTSREAFDFTFTPPPGVAIRGCTAADLAKLARN